MGCGSRASAAGARGAAHTRGTQEVTPSKPCESRAHSWASSDAVIPEGGVWNVTREALK